MVSAIGSIQKSNEADTLQELLKKIEQKKIESTILQEENLKKEMKRGNLMNNRKDSSMHIKNFGNSINENFERKKNVLECNQISIGTIIYSSQHLITLISPGCSNNII